MIVGVLEGEVVEGGVLGADGVGVVGAGGAVVPGEGDHGPAVVEVDGEDKVVARQVPHHRRHLRLRRLRRQLLAQRTPVGKTSVEILVVCVGSGFVNTSIRVQ